MLDSSSQVWPSDGARPHSPTTALGLRLRFDFVLHAHRGLVAPGFFHDTSRAHTARPYYDPTTTLLRPYYALLRLLCVWTTSHASMANAPTTLASASRKMRSLACVCEKSERAHAKFASTFVCVHLLIQLTVRIGLILCVLECSVPHLFFAMSDQCNMWFTVDLDDTTHQSGLLYHSTANLNSWWFTFHSHAHTMSLCVFCFVLLCEIETCCGRG